MMHKNQDWAATPTSLFIRGKNKTKHFLRWAYAKHKDFKHNVTRRQQPISAERTASNKSNQRAALTTAIW